MELELGKPCPWCGGFVNDAPGIGLYCVGDNCTMPSPFCTDRAMGAMEEFTAPKHLRKGQALFCFLTWISAHKKVQHLRIADDHPWEIANTFYVEDDALEAWWNEWVESLEQSK